MVGPAKPDHYLDIYRRLFERYEVESVLELGVHQGGSLRFFHELAPLARITGIDHDMGLVTERDPDIEYVTGDATDVDLLARYSPDVVIDDASHIWQDQQASFVALWPRTRLLYVIEDLDTCYRPGSEWARGWNTMDWLYSKVDALTLRETDIAAITFHPGLVVIER